MGLRGRSPDRDRGRVMVDSGPPGDHSGRSYGLADEIRRSWYDTRRRAHGRGFVSGAALMIQRQCFEELGGFDARYFLLDEDIDPLMRAYAAGIRTVASPKCGRAAARPPPQHRRVLCRRDPHGPTSRAAASIAKDGTPLAWERTYVALDTFARGVAHRVRGDRARSSAYSGRWPLSGALPRSSFCARAWPVPVDEQFVIPRTGPLRS